VPVPGPTSRGLPDPWRWAPWLIFALLPGFFLAGAAGVGETLYGKDVVAGYYHLRALVGRALAEGRIPVWDPHTMAGTPLLATLHPGVFYPPTWAATFLPPGLFWSFTVWLHMSLAGGFAFGWLARGLGVHRGAALAGSLVFMLAAEFTVRIAAGHMSHLSAYPWVAALLWRIERWLHAPGLRRFVLLGAVAALLLLSGFPHFLMIAFLLAGVRVLHWTWESRRDARRTLRTALGAAGSLAWGLALSAPQLFPTLELIPHVQRVSLDPESFVSSFSMPPENLLSLLAPGLFGEEARAPYWGRWNIWETSGFIGTLSLLAALPGFGKDRRSGFWGVVALGGLLLALGPSTPAFPLFRILVPGAELFRVPGRYLLIFTVAGAALVALGIHALLARRGPETPPVPSWVAAAAAGLAAALAAFRIALSAGDAPAWKALVAWAGRSASPPGPEALSVAQSSLGAAALFVALGAGVLALGRFRRLDGTALAVALGALSFVELAAAGARHFRGYPEEQLRWPAPLVELLRSAPGPSRVATAGTAELRPIGLCQGAGLQHVGGYDPMMLRRYTELMNAIHGQPPERFINGLASVGPHPVLDMLGARFWLVAGPLTPDAAWVPRAAIPGFRLFENPAALPRAWRVGTARSIPDRTDRLRALAGGFDPAEEVILESGVGLPPGASSEGTTSVLEASPGYYRIRTTGPAPACLVLSEAGFPGWTARIGDRETPILRANHLVQAVAVGPGERIVEFRYRSAWMERGVLACGAALLLPAILGLARRPYFRRLRWEK
jgi:hypothetical protein